MPGAGNLEQQHWESCSEVVFQFELEDSKKVVNSSRVSLLTKIALVLLLLVLCPSEASCSY